MDFPGSRDQQVEWFHSLAALPDSDLYAWAHSSNGADLLTFVKLHLPGVGAPNLSNAAEVASAVRSLRQNEKAWNRSLMQALADADDEHGRGASTSARDRLLSFANECPWLLFKEVANNQASHYR